MDQIVDWEYYSSHFDKKVTEDTFDIAEERAEDEVKLVIGWIRFAEIDSEAFYYEQLKKCICNAINKSAEQGASGKGIASVSNDGYSESYTIQTETQAIAELQGCIKHWLSGTGLVGAY